MEKIGYEGLAAQKLAHESFVDKLTGINMWFFNHSRR